MFPNNVYFFDVPVYRLTEKQYISSWQTSDQYKILQSVSPQAQATATEALIKSFGGQ